MKDYAPLVTEIENSITGFQKQIPAVQRDMLNQVIEMLTELDTTNGNIDVSAKNVRLIGKIKSKLMDLILTDDYKDAVKQYAKAFDQVTTLQHAYFADMEDTFKPPKVAEAMKVQSVESVVSNLTERGIDANVVSAVEDILRTSITSGGSISELHEALRNNIINNDAGEGTLQKYTKQITTDALNQHAAQYTQIVSSDLGLKWYRYQGSLIETSRPFCQACRDKDYIHESEFPALLRGDFPEFEAHDGKIYKGLPAGMIPDTTPSNFPINRGGYNCGHQLRPVRDESVPQAIRDALNT